MRAVGTVALLANAISFALLWAFRQGDSNMRLAWIWRRNDVLGNLAVMLAALGVFGHRLARYRGCVPSPAVPGSFSANHGPRCGRRRRSNRLNRRLDQEARLRNTKCNMPAFRK